MSDPPRFKFPVLTVILSLSGYLAVALLIHAKVLSAAAAASGALVWTGIVGLTSKIWARAEKTIADLVGDALDVYIRDFASRYGKRYAKHVNYKTRTFDIKGFSHQGKFALELENVYVDLDVEPAPLDAIPASLVELSKPDGDKGPRDVFTWLRAGSEQPCNFAIVGPPGSGKTTLLKHLALRLAADKGPFRLTPMLLFIRDQAQTIGANPAISLAELAEAALKSELPSPAGWFERRLRRGKCLVMFDGLDEVADPVLRHAVAEWVERQVQVLGANRFLVSSRPNGYRGNQIAGFSLLKVLPFRHAQVERFVSNWYLANEVMAHQKDDAGVRADAKNCADELLRRLSQMPTLQELAVNPLLLTLIATVHRYRSELPGRRVELYAEICDVFLGKRQRAKGIELDLTPAQKVRVLRVLAYYMMNRGTSEIGTEEAEKIIAEALMRVDPQASPAAFLKMVEDSSGLLLAQECDSYGFAHKTFQEYLASLHVKEEGIEKALLRHCSETWWNETIRLYVAQADGSAVVSACIAQDRPPLEALLLATDCAREALELRTDLRDRLRHLTEESLEDSDPERRRLAAEVTLAQRLKNMVRVQDDVFFDHSPVTYAE